MLYALLRLFETWLLEQGMYGYFGVLNQLHFRALAAAGLAFALVVALGRRTIAFLARMKIGDPGLTDAEALRSVAASKAHTPTMGGVLIVAAMVLSTLLLADLSNYYVAMGLVVLLWLAGVGWADDWLKLTASRRGAGSRQGLYSWEKLVFQLGIGLLIGVFAYGRGDNPDVANDIAHCLNLPFQKTYDPEQGWAANPALFYLPRWAYVVLSMLMIAGLSNAVNISDGMDGLAAGTTAIVGIGLLVLVLIAGSMNNAQLLLVPFVEGTDELSILVGAMLGACLGFLWWNCSPASVFMGDTGAIALGGLVGYVALVTRQEFVVLLMCGVFLVEIGSVVLQVGYFRATKGRRLFHCSPYHYHLHMSGWTEQKIVVRFWIITFLLGIVALASIKVR